MNVVYDKFAVVDQRSEDTSSQNVGYGMTVEAED